MIHNSIIENYPELNDQQKEIIGHIDGPLLVIAGPGSGKTYSLVLRAVNILLQGHVKPSEIILCTFTEKAAFEMRDRMSEIARKVNYSGDLSQTLINTIHGISNNYVTRYRHNTILGHGYQTLDELTQLFFLYDHFDEIFGPPDDEGQYLTHWTTKWTTIHGIKEYFNKIT